MIRRMKRCRLLGLVSALAVLSAPTAVTASAQIQQCQGLDWQKPPAHPQAIQLGSSGSSKTYARSSATEPIAPATVTQKGIVKYKSTPESPTQFLQLLTGPGSPDRTDKKWGVTATDLGFAYESEDASGIRSTNLVFGDTFSCSGNGGWRSNVILRTDDLNYGDGLNVRTALTGNGYTPSGTARQFIEARHAPNESRTEVTAIPTTAIVVDGVHYMDYMSVRHWGEPGEWSTNYAATMRSTDDGVTWERVEESIRPNSSTGITLPEGAEYRPGNENLQMSAYVEDVKDSRYVYRFSTRNGRSGPAVLGRALKTDFPRESAFEFWNGHAWVNDASQAEPVINAPVSELSVAYSSYLNEYVALYRLRGQGLVLRTSETLTGPWSEPSLLISQETVPDLYGGFLLPNQDDQHLYYVATAYSGYNVMLMRSDLDRVVEHNLTDDGIVIEEIVKVAEFPSDEGGTN
ncbi:hypothetical protein CENDO_05355 [Corynebacterium endometrii]|uniref:DUF4185 domain-containing protein n=2 Tax=Corynebacterium endometrii TaxID=2488819 RepID=A0A4P7QFB8_9CORY|nr:hypothetical protein CENDO_05355 [Corynebacterium endometrii]